MTTLTAGFFTHPDKGLLVITGYFGNVCGSLDISNEEGLWLWQAG
jgi:hypothetical protein